MEFIHAKQQKLYRCIHFIFILHKIYTQTRNFTVAAIVVVAFYGLLVIYLFWSFFLHFIQFDFYGRFCFMPNPSVHSTHQRQSYSTMKRYNNCVFVCVYMSCWWSWIPVFIPPNHKFTSNVLLFLSSTKRTKNSPCVYILRDFTAHQLIQYNVSFRIKTVLFLSLTSYEFCFVFTAIFCIHTRRSSSIGHNSQQTQQTYHTRENFHVLRLK